MAVVLAPALAGAVPWEKAGSGLKGDNNDMSALWQRGGSGAWRDALQGVCGVLAAADTDA